ncbi:MAG: MFS transporter, partial [Actinobacteria bacterium]|nr:MFS transporter [Actinomycetota bacterium]
VLGWAVAHWGWRAAFLLTGPLFTLLAIGSGVRLHARNEDLAAHEHDPADPDLASPTHADSTGHGGHGAAHRTLETLGNPKRLKPAIWIYFVMQPFAQMLVFAVNGDWFVEHLDMTTGGLSTATALLGVAELVGTLCVMGFADRLGPVRVGAAALIATAFPLVALTLVEPTIFWGVALLIVMDFCVELSFVSVLPVVTELNIKNRGKAVSQVFMLMMVARAVSSAVAGLIYTNVGFDTTLLLSAGVAVIGGLALVWAQLGRATPSSDPAPAAPAAPARPARPGTLAGPA